MPRVSHDGAELLNEAGLVAFTRCGHWWVYPVHASPEQLHELARFNLGLVCSFCLATWQAATCARVPGTVSRVN